MSPRRTASGNSSGGGKRSKSGEFPSVAEPEAKAGPAANNPASVAPNAPEVDAGWDASDPTQQNAKSDDKTTVRIEVTRPQAPTARTRVSQTSVGPRSPEAKVEVALLNERTNVPKDKSSGRARSPSSPGGATTNAGPPVLNQWLSEGSENNFHPSQIAHLVIDVMGIETPVSSEPQSSISKSESDASVSKSESEAIAAASVEPPRSLPPVTTDDDGWDVAPPEAPAATVQKTVAAESRGKVSVRPSSAPAATVQKTVAAESPGKISVRPSSAPAATVQKTVAAESRGKISVKPASKSAPISDKSRAKRAAVLERGTHHARSEGLDSEWAREFFASNATDLTPVEEYHESDEDIDERHLRSISPEAKARRARYRIVVIGLIVAMTLLLAVAVALKLLHKH
jgi:hypothetical protein